MEFNLKNFGVRFGSSTDQYTRMLPLHVGYYLRGLFQSTEIWETINNNEFNLYNTTVELQAVLNKKAIMLTNGISVIKSWETGEIIKNHPLLKLLEKPNPLMNRNAWLIDLSLKHDLYGNAYIFKNQGSALSDYPSQLSNLPNSDMKIITSGRIWKQNELDKIILKYVLETSKEEFKPNEVIHIKNNNPNDPIRGLSPLNAIQMDLSNIRGAKGFRNVNITKRGALGIISPDGKDAIGALNLTPDQRKELQKEFIRDNGIFDNQSPIKFADIPIRYDNLSYPIKDNMLFEEVSEDFKKVAHNYNMSETLFVSNQSKFSNLNEGIKNSYQDGVIPFSEKISYALNDGLGLMAQGVYHEFDFSHVEVLRENEESKAKVIETKVKALNTLIANGYKPSDAEKIVGLRF